MLHYKPQRKDSAHHGRHKRRGGAVRMQQTIIIQRRCALIDSDLRVHGPDSRWGLGPHTENIEYCEIGIWWTERKREDTDDAATEFVNDDIRGNETNVTYAADVGEDGMYCENVGPRGGTDPALTGCWMESSYQQSCGRPNRSVKGIGGSDACTRLQDESMIG